MSDDNNKNNLIFWIPASFSEQSLPEQWRPYYAEACYWLHLIARRTCWRQQNKFGYVQLKASYLRKVIGQPIQKALGEMLEAEGIIACDGSFDYRYQPKCRGYRFTEAYSGPTRREILKYSPFVERVTRERAKKSRLPPSVAYRHVADSLKKVELDRASALMHVDLQELTEAELIAIESIDAGEWNCSVDKFGRMHSELTHVRSELRQFLRIDGQGLIEFDIANSQLLFLVAIIEAYQADNKSVCFSNGKITRKTKGQIAATVTSNAKAKTTKKQEPPHPTTNTVSSTLVEHDLYASRLACERVNNKNLNPCFRSICEAGKLYEFLLEKSSIPSITTRADVKQAVFEQVLFGSKKGHIAKLFRAYFPEVMAAITNLKKQNKAYLAHLLQMWESSFVYHRVIQRVTLDEPSMPVLTIHDSFLTTPEYAEILEWFIHEEFKAIGLSATVKRRALTEDAPTCPVEPLIEPLTTFDAPPRPCGRNIDALFDAMLLEFAGCHELLQDVYLHGKKFNKTDAIPT